MRIIARLAAVGAALTAIVVFFAVVCIPNPRHQPYPGVPLAFAADGSARCVPASTLFEDLCGYWITKYLHGHA